MQTHTCTFARLIESKVSSSFCPPLPPPHTLLYSKGESVIFVLHIRGSGGSNSVMIKKAPKLCPLLLFPKIICCQCWFLGCQTYCTFKFYVDDKPTKTEAISDTINPDFKFEKKCGYPSVTQGVRNPGYFRRGSKDCLVSKGSHWYLQWHEQMQYDFGLWRKRATGWLLYLLLF